MRRQPQRRDIRRVLCLEQRQHDCRAPLIPSAIIGIDRAQHCAFIEAQIGGTAISGGGIAVALHLHQRIAHQQMGLGCPGCLPNELLRFAKCRAKPPGIDQPAHIIYRQNGIVRAFIKRTRCRFQRNIAAKGCRHLTQRNGGAIKQPCRPIAFIGGFKRLTRQPQHIAVGITAHRNRTQHRQRAAWIARFEKCSTQQPPCHQVHRLQAQQAPPLINRLLIGTRPVIKHAAQQQRPRLTHQRAIGALKQAARQIVILRACSEHRLQIQRLRAARSCRQCPPCCAQHRRIAPGIAQRRGILNQGIVPPGINLQRGFKPRQGGDQPILPAHQLAAQHQRVDIAPINRQRTVRSGDGTGDVARLLAYPAQIGPGHTIGTGGGFQYLGEQPLRFRQLALRRQRPRPDPQRIKAVAGLRLVDFTQRAFGIALQQPGMGIKLMCARDIETGITRTAKLALRCHALSQRQIGAREHGMRQPPARIGSNGL